MSQELTEILHRMVLEGEQSARAVAERIGKPYTTMLREINPHDAGAKVGVDLLLPLMVATGSVEPLKHLAREMGYSLVPLAAGEPTEKDPMRLALRILEHYGELSRNLGGVLREDPKSGGCLEAMERSGQEAVRATLELLELLRSHHRQEPKGPAQGDASRSKRLGPNGSREAA